MARGGMGRWTAEEHARLLVAIIKVGNPKLDTKAIAREMDNGRTDCAIYFEIRRIKQSVGAITAKNAKRRPDVDVDAKVEIAPEETLPSPEPSPIRQRPVRTAKASAKKRLHDEVGDSGFWDDSEKDLPVKSSKRGKVKAESNDADADEADFVDDADSPAEA